jgi:hypothetical protein
VAVQIYEREHNCKVNEFGCIPHKNVKGLAASPDGIIIQEDSDKYGHMLEIKCVSSRVINGVVPEQYWMQMQVQMEVCDLEYCDFLECLFLEKPFYEEWMDYVLNVPKIKWYGILLEGVVDGEPKYIYGKLNDTEHPQIPENFTATQVHYWYLNTISIQTIKRNREWFAEVLPRVNHAVKMLDEERHNANEESDESSEDDEDDRGEDGDKPAEFEIKIPGMESKPETKKVKRIKKSKSKTKVKTDVNTPTSKPRNKKITNFFTAKDAPCMIDSD